MMPKLPTELGIEPEDLQIFEGSDSGYHCICLEKPYTLTYISSNIHQLLGYTSDEIYSMFKENPVALFYEEDIVPKALAFLGALAEREQTLSWHYKLRKKDGTPVAMSEIATSQLLPDGKMYSISILSQLSPSDHSKGKKNKWRVEKSVGDIVSSVMPYGFMQCTCEKFPKIIYINQPLLEHLLIENSPEPWEDYAKYNIYFMIPFEEREKFSQYLEQAILADSPIRVEHHMYRGDGSLTHLVGWISVMTNPQGEKEFSLLYRHVEELPSGIEEIKKSSYFAILQSAYNVIFHFNLETNMVELIHANEDSPLRSMLELPMTTEKAIPFYINNYVYSEDRSVMLTFLKQISNPQDDWSGHSLIQVDNHLALTTGVLRYLFVASHIDKNQVLLGCRNIEVPLYPSISDKESTILHRFYNWLDYLSTAHHDNDLGGLMIEQSTQGSILLYATANVLQYIGLGRNEIPSHRSILTLDECLEAAGLTDKDWGRLISGKKLYLWSKTIENAFQFELSCKSYYHNDRTLYYVTCKKFSLPEPEKQESIEQRVFARTFGHFDLFVDNVPVTFSNIKEKELFALLIDRNGGTLTSSEAITYLWEDEPVDEHTSARYRKLAMGLKRTLEKYGIENIIINKNGVRSIDTSLITCDYYELLKGNAKYRQAFHNAYMTDYSWSEETLATLWDYSGDM